LIPIHDVPTIVSDRCFPMKPIHRSGCLVDLQGKEGREAPTEPIGLIDVVPWD
jgi:hypothetical protein